MNDLQLEKKLELSKQAYELALLQNDQTVLAEVLFTLAGIYRSQAFYDIAGSHYNQSLALFQSAGDSLGQARVLIERGFNYLQRSDFDAALTDYQDALHVHEARKDSAEIVNDYLNICSLFLTYFQRKKNASALEDSTLFMAKEYYNQVQPYLKGVSPAIQAKAYNLQGRLLRSEKKFDEAEAAFLACIQIRNAIGDSIRRTSSEISLGVHYLYWGDYLRQSGKPEEAKTQYRKAHPLFTKSLIFKQKANDNQGIVDAYINLGGMNKRMQNYPSAIDTLHLGAKIASDLNLTGDRAHISRLLSEIFEEKGQADSALHYHKLYKKIQDEMFNNQSEQTIRFTEVHFETEKIEKEKLIAQQQSQQKSAQLRLVFIVGTLLVMMIGGIGFYYYQRNQTQKQLMAQQREINSQLVVDLMKEQAIENLNSRLEGQEYERERIARDIHDQLGGTLSAVKLSLEGIKNRLSPGSELHFDRTYQLLDQACTETRQLSHDMMALSLKHLGLEASVKELCHTLNNSGKLHIDFQTLYPQPVKLPQKTERHLYRIVQELIQNVIKHAEATRIVLQISISEGLLTMVLEDNGKGFDPDKTGKKSGMGISNIQARLKDISGHMDIDSQPGRGTTIIIEAPVNP
ncbi:MAG: sensor histidine kinase [Bacteroidia bacterium]